MARKDTLGKLQMPKKPMAETEAEMDLGLEDLGEEMPEGEMLEEEGMEDEGLTMYSDEELIEEMQLRGLSLDEAEEMVEGEDLDLEDDNDIAEPGMIIGAE